MPEPDTDLVVVSRAALLAAVPCECGPHYSERGLVAPHCRHHDLRTELEHAPIVSRGWASGLT